MNRLLAILIALVALGAAAAGISHNRAGAQEGGGHSLAVVIRANRFATGQGGEIVLVGGLLNRGHETLRVPLSCAPPVDFEVRNENGDVVWELRSQCGSDDHELTLRPGEERVWEAVWPGTDDPGTYYAYATIQTRPRDAVGGPLPITVHEGEPPPDPTDRPRETPHPDRTHEPDPTDNPHETPEPDPTDHPEGPTYPDAIFPVADWDDAQRYPDVDGRWEPADCQQLVVWLDDAQDGIYGRFVEPEWHGDDFRISGESAPAGPASVAYNRSRGMWLAVWTEESDAAGLEIKGRYVECGGLEGPVFTIGTHERDDHSPAVAAFGEAWAVTWVRDVEGGRVIRGARVVGLDTGQQVAIADGHVGQPALACRSADHCFVVWTNGVEEGRDVLGRRWWPASERLDTGFAVAESEAAEHEPSIAAGERTAPYLVAWTRTGDVSRVYARFVHSSGEMAQGEAFNVSGEGTGMHPDVSSAGFSFNVVWSSAADHGTAIRGRSVSMGDAGPSMTEIATVSRPAEGAPEDIHPAVATAGGGIALVVWERGRDADPGDILGRYVRWHGAREGGRVVLIGRVLGGGMLASEAGVIDVRVERVLEGTFPCAEARVYYAADTPLPPELGPGDRIYVIGEPLVDAQPCALDVAAPGTVISAAGPERLFAPSALTTQD